MTSETATDPTSINLTVEDLQVSAEVCSVSGTGLAVLRLDDPSGAIHGALTRILEASAPIRLGSMGGAPPPAEVSLVWFEECDEEGREVRRLELIVDGSECGQWGQLMQPWRAAT